MQEMRSSAECKIPGAPVGGFCTTADLQALNRKKVACLTALPACEIPFVALISPAGTSGGDLALM